MENRLNIKQIAALVLLVLITVGAFGQKKGNGKLLSQKSFSPDKNMIEDLNDEHPGSNYADTFKLAEMSRITYKSDGYKIAGFLVRPTQPGNYPCIIYNRDGWDNNGVLTDMDVARDLHKMARWGYVVVASQYRGAGGSEGEDEFGGRDVDDVINLVELLGRIPEADTTRIGMCGTNRGGMMTYIALSKTKRIDAAVVSSGISNLFLWAADCDDPKVRYDLLERLIPDYPGDRVGPLKERSLVFWAKYLSKDTPILLLQGTADRNIHPSNTIKAYEKLFDKLHPTRMIMLEGGDNELSQHQAEVDLNMRKWFNKYVRDGEDFPTIPDLTR